jgi:uncharacterized membrane protein
VAVLLGILVAAGFGSGDFMGGLASKRAPTVAVLGLCQIVAIVFAAIVTISVGGPVYGQALLFGAVTGVLNLAAVGCLYKGLAIGQMGQVAPIAAVIGSVLPVCWGLIRGERPGALALVGIALAIVAAALLSSDRDERQGSLFGPALVLAIAAGSGFGVSLIFFAEAGHHAGLWPVLSARCAALVAIWVVIIATRSARAVASVPKVQSTFAGLFDVGSSTLLLIALHSHPTAVIAPIAALAPGFTTFHAWWNLHERVSRVQLFGLAMALAALALIAT